MEEVEEEEVEEEEVFWKIPSIGGGDNGRDVFQIFRRRNEEFGRVIEYCRRVNGAKYFQPRDLQQQTERKHTHTKRGKEENKTMSMNQYKKKRKRERV